MPPISHLIESTPPFLLGQRRGIRPPNRFDLHLTCENDRADSGATARLGTYPSPPMSGSPPLPPNPAREASARRGDISNHYAPTGPREIYRGNTNQLPPPNPREQLPTPLLHSRSYPSEPTGAMSYSYPRVDDSVRKPPYPLASPHGLSREMTPQCFVSATGPSSVESYSNYGRSPAIENHPFTSPKSQRKAKGHVASACVPCKKAHLRLVHENSPVPLSYTAICCRFWPHSD